MISSAEIDLIRRDPAIPGLAVVFDRSLQSFQLRWLLQQPLARRGAQRPGRLWRSR